MSHRDAAIIVHDRSAATKAYKGAFAQAQLVAFDAETGKSYGRERLALDQAAVQVDLQGITGDGQFGPDRIIRWL